MRLKRETEVAIAIGTRLPIWLIRLGVQAIVAYGFFGKTAADAAGGEAARKL